MPGLEESAARIARAFPVGETSACAIALSSATTGAGFERWPGMRDEIATGHPVAVALSKATEDERYPVACDDTVRALSAVAGFQVSGQVCSIDGVTVPAGRSQLKFLVHARWRALFHPMARVQEIYAGNPVYDRVMTTDHIQRQLWGFGVFEFVGYLDAILSKSPELFVALWLRRWEDLDRLTSQAGSQGGPSLSEIFGTPVLLTLKTGDRDSFLAPWAIMSEIERIVEIANQMRARRGITSAAVRARVTSQRGSIIYQDLPRNAQAGNSSRSQNGDCPLPIHWRTFSKYSGRNSMFCRSQKSYRAQRFSSRRIANLRFCSRRQEGLRLGRQRISIRG